ncbi:lysozyme inhibitor [Duganella aceris]|uniref:Lysozyme inhibitor n=1 Tax=Duganella aceris TaxID=2703883 RepID=A0ABX0FL78_9BURK|nr:lysozyme inhibitor [Duganella aceris]NGZ85344.1 lysozyme inhibitor [Duganella aceris]
MSISKLFMACSLAFATLTVATAAQAQTDTPAKKTVKKAAAKPKAKAVVAPPVEPKAPDEEADEPVVTDTSVVEFDCELGNKITIYQNDNDESHIALRWKKRLHRLTRVGTTTGAKRFENKLYGLIWIGIPAKGMLLDSKLNRQLANECRNAEQLKPVATKENEPSSAKISIQ